MLTVTSASSVASTIAFTKQVCNSHKLKISVKKCDLFLALDICLCLKFFFLVVINNQHLTECSVLIIKILNV